MLPIEQPPEGDIEKPGIPEPAQKQAQEGNKLSRGRPSKRDDFLSAIKLKEIVSRLQPDGPAVDFELLVGYIDGVLEKDATERVGKHIVTFRAWYDAFWETVGALDPNEGA